ncbi:M16 family metallopeptidase [Aurantibacillus circumpalustris]|uniref:M16 family metallopeptidase n=1 Tax=Aurantibacillus circumpalustris TaxID=3036359 RepID=UPI00295B5286|nr:insulinase family protein [Aurantibacillus circumpalustris]
MIGFKKNVFFVISIILFNTNLNAQTNEDNTKTTSLNNYEQIPNDPLNARIYTLNNGMKVYLSVYKNAPRIQTYIAVKAGSKNDPANATGLAHYLEHMVFKGTDVYGTKDFEYESKEIKKIENLYEVYRTVKDEAERAKIYHKIDSISGLAAKFAIANEYDKMLATIGADGTNAFTSFDQTVYVNDIPSNQIENWLKIEAERFRNPVLRLFHTELEAVYEEKNRGIDSDGNKVWEALFSALFKNHTYGTQTTIGTIEHLKNPSMVEINKYYRKYYVPNNMAIIMSGDFDPDKVIKQIDKSFGSVPSKPVDTYTFSPEKPIAKKIVKEILGPNPANVNLAWRFAGDGTSDADICTLIAGLLYNNTAGLMDINLNQAQKVLSSGNYFYPLKDYSFFYFNGEPKEGQSLEEVENLILSQIELIKKGTFPDWLITAVVTDLKLRKTKELESNDSRASTMMNAFVNDLTWKKAIESIERISKITKQEVIEFANKNFTSENYAVAYKRTGEDKSIVKVEKPAITPVELDRENASAFVKDIERASPTPIEPKFLDYDKDINHLTLKSSIPLLHNKNIENSLFELYYKFDFGSNNDKLYPIAVKYIPYLSTADMSAAQIKQELYKLGCSFNVYCDNETIWISLSGLADNFEKSLKLFEKVLANPVVEQPVLENLIADIMKERNDNKLEKRIILNRAMTSYARYGTINPFSNVYSDVELTRISVEDIKKMILLIPKYKHKVLYYGPTEAELVKNSLNASHNVAKDLLEPVASLTFKEKVLDSTVYVVDYDMKQAEIMMLSNGSEYNKNGVPLIYLYNSYFGGGMSSVLFQDLRESKALAYSTYSRYNQPNKLSKKYYNVSYIGSQADKLEEALKGLSDLLNDMPKADGSFSSAKDMILQEMRTQRITKADILFNYLAAEDLGNKADIRKDIFEKVKNYGFEDIKNFQLQAIAKKPRTVLVLGKKEGLNMKVLKHYGNLKFLTLEEIFGY